MTSKELDIDVRGGMVRMGWSFANLALGLGRENYTLAFARSRTQWGLFEWASFTLFSGRMFNGARSSGIDIPSHSKGYQFPFIEQLPSLHMSFSVSGGPTFGGYPTVAIKISGGPNLGRTFYQRLIRTNTWGVRFSNNVGFSGRLTNISNHWNNPAPGWKIAQAMLQR